MLIGQGLYASERIDKLFPPQNLPNTFEMNYVASGYLQSLSFGHFEENSTKWSDPFESFEGKKEFFLSTNAFASYTLNSNLSFGYTTKHYAYATFNEGLVSIASSLLSKSLTVKEGVYDVAIEYTSVDMHGLFLNLNLPLDKHTLSINAELLSGINYNHAGIDGSVSKLSSGTDYYLKFYQVYNQENVLTQLSYDKNITSYGYSIDLQYHYKGDDLDILLGVNNVLSYTVWDTLQDFRGDVTSDQLYQDDEGYNHIRSLLEGNYKEVQNTLVLPQLYYGKLAYQVDAFRYGLSDIYVQTQHIYEMSIGYKTTIGEVSASYQPSFNVLSIGFSSAYFDVGLSHTLLTLSDANYLSAYIAARY